MGPGRGPGITYPVICQKQALGGDQEESGVLGAGGNTELREAAKGSGELPMGQEVEEEFSGEGRGDT